MQKKFTFFTYFVFTFPAYGKADKIFDALCQQTQYFPLFIIDNLLSDDGQTNQPYNTENSTKIWYKKLLIKNFFTIQVNSIVIIDISENSCYKIVVNS